MCKFTNRYLHIEHLEYVQNSVANKSRRAQSTPTRLTHIFRWLNLRAILSLKNSDISQSFAINQLSSHISFFFRSSNSVISFWESEMNNCLFMHAFPYVGIVRDLIETVVKRMFYRRMFIFTPNLWISWIWKCVLFLSAT